MIFTILDETRLETRTTHSSTADFQLSTSFFSIESLADSDNNL